MATVWMRSRMTRTWTWFHPKPWAPLCAAAPRARRAPCSDVRPGTWTFEGWTLTSAGLSRCCLTPSLYCSSAAARCLRTSSPEAKLLLLQQGVLRPLGPNEDADGRGSKPYLLWPQSLTNSIYLSSLLLIGLPRMVITNYISAAVSARHTYKRDVCMLMLLSFHESA